MEIWESHQEFDSEFFSFQEFMSLEITHQQQRRRRNTHTHTHTHIYIYIYIYMTLEAVNGLIILLFVYLLKITIWLEKDLT